MIRHFPGFKSDRPVVVVTSDEPWGHVWHTQLHFAYSLSESFNVVFVGPPSKWTLRSLFSPKIILEDISSTLKVISYSNPIPSLLGKWSVRINDWFNGLMISNLAKGCRVELVWHFDRYRSVFFFRSPSVKHIYHVIDPVANLNFDRYLSVNADLVVSVSRRYLDHYKGLNRNVAYEGQGWDPSLLAKASESSVSQNLNHGSMLLLGTFLDDVDYELLIQLRSEIKGVPMVLIGPDRTRLPERRSLFLKLCGLPEVFWLGALPPVEYLQHIAASAVCLIAYEPTGKVFNRIRVFGTPLKVMSYLGCHKPVVSSIDCEIPELANIAIHEASSHIEFIEKVRGCLTGGLVFEGQQVEAYLNKVTYGSIISRLLLKIGVNPQS